MKANIMIHRSARAAIKLLLAALLPATAQTAWAWQGQGTQESPYQIKNASDLDQLATNVNSGTDDDGKFDADAASGYSSKYFVLTNDISYTHDTDWNNDADTENNYTAIGCAGHPFKGHFDGKGKTVSGIRIYKNGTGDANSYQGLFGYISVGAEVKNVVLADARITGYYSIGGIAGKHDGGTISNCHVLSNVVVHNVYNSGSYHGGIVGYNLGLVEGCTSAASITTATGSSLAICGGIVGYNCYKQNGNTRIVDCLYLGSNVAGGSRVGAIAGLNTGKIENSYYSSGSVSGKNENGDNLANANCAVGYFSTGDNYGPVENVGRAYSVIAGQGVNIETFVPTGSVKKNYTPEGIATDAITAYDLGLAYCGRAYTACVVGDYCAAAGTVSLTLSNTAGEAPLGYRYNYLASAGTISGGAGNSYTLTMPAKDVTITTALRSTRNRVNVAYVDEYGQTQHVDAIALDGTESSLIYGRYYVGTDINYTNRIEFTDDSKLILGDGCTMTVNTGTDAIRANRSLAIYGQALGTGKLNANGVGFGIYDSGNLTINGGNVTATATGENGYGIYAYNGNVTIIGGNVSANGGTYGISADGNITLGWTNASDHIYANSYNIGTGKISINHGQVLTDADGNHYYYNGDVSADKINGKHLYPYIPNLKLAANQAPDQNFWTTFYCGHTDYQIYANENACAYTATYEGDQLTLHRLGKAVPKATAVIIVADNNEVSMIAATSAITPVAPADNDLRGVDTDSPVADIIAAVANTDLAGATPFVLGMTIVNNEQHFGFHRYTGEEMPARKAFVLVAASSNANARALTMVFDDATGVEEVIEVNGVKEDNDDSWYTLDGRKLNGKPSKSGLYIYKGRKVVIK